jgi:hypothetical protein
LGPGAPLQFLTNHALLLIKPSLCPIYEGFVKIWTYGLKYSLPVSLEMEYFKRQRGDVIAIIRHSESLKLLGVENS